MLISLLFAVSFTEFFTTAMFIGFGILALGIVIFVHELGHFVVAKMCGVKCEKFYVGFDPPLKYLPSALFKKKVGETEYGLGIIPFGGYVKMLGQDDNPANSAKEAQRIRIARENQGQHEDDETEFRIDPRSYPAKPVWQRLMIISAGVITNLIFAVLFGTLAYRMGVSYTPCIVESTSPGLSGWQVGLQPGDQILQVGRDGKRSDKLRFVNDMILPVIMTGIGQDLDLLVKPLDAPADADPIWVPVHLRGSAKEEGRPFIGMSAIGTNIIGMVFDEQFTNVPTAALDLQPQDKIVAINGRPVDSEDEIKNHVIVTTVLAKEVDREVTLTIERTGKKKERPITTHDIKIRPNPMRWLGLGMKIGPVAAIQKGSPAESAGFQEGDLIKMIQGQDVTNALIVPHLLRRLAGQNVEFVVDRKAGDAVEEMKLNAALRTPTMRHAIPTGIFSYVAAEALGIAFNVKNVVHTVSDGTPAAEAGMQTGDIITAVEFKAESEEKRVLSRLPKKPLDLTKYENDWPMVQYVMQFCLPGTKVELRYLRNGKPQTAEMLPVTSEDWHVEHRGLVFLGETRINQVDDFSEAFALGIRETKEGLMQVGFALKKIFSGTASTKQFGGPLTIMYVAGAEAEKGLARLLTFLTMLSANLAVLNFLPIPVLDGGHAMFLIYEGIFRKPLDERIAFGLTLFGFCFIIGLMIFMFGLDIWRFAGMLNS